MPSELVGEVLKWLTTGTLYPIRTLCKTAYIVYTKRIKSPIGLEIETDSSGYRFDYYYDDLCLSKSITWRENHPTNISNLFPSSILCLSLISWDMLFSITTLKHCPDIQELYYEGSQCGILTKELIKPLNKLAIIHFSECLNDLRLQDLLELDIYAYFPSCCYYGRVITFPKNNHHPMSNNLHKLFDTIGYSQYYGPDVDEEFCDQGCNLWDNCVNKQDEKIYAFREKARLKDEDKIEGDKFDGCW